MNPSQPTTVRYQTVGWLTLAAALAYLCRNAVSVAESTIRQDMGLTLSQSGWFMGSFFWTYAIFQVPSGWFSGRFGTRKALTLFALGWAFAMMGICLTSVFLILLLGQLLLGVAQAGIFPASTNSIGHWMPLAHRTLACGFLAAGMQIGAVLASGLTGVLLIPFGWRGTFFLFALPSVLWAVGFYLQFRDLPSQNQKVNALELALIHEGRDTEAKGPLVKTNEFRTLLTLVNRPVMYFLCGQQICRAAGYMFFASWFPTFLQETRGVTVAQSGFLQGLVLVGTLFGSLFGGMLTDFIWRRTGDNRLSRSGVGAGALGICGLLIFGAWFVENPATAVALMALGSLFAALAGPCALAATIDIGGSRVPQVYGLMNMCGNFAAAACPVLVAKLFQWTENWNVVLLMFSGVYLTGAACWLFANPKTQNRDNQIGRESNH